MSNTDPKYWTEQQRQEIRQIGSLNVSEFRKLMLQCLAENTRPEPSKKPMTDFREYFEEMHSQLQEDYGDNVHIFEAGFKEGARWVQLDHSVFKHHGIGDADV